MDWKNLNSYFEYIPTDFLQQLFHAAEFPWSPLGRLKGAIEDYFRDKTDQGNLQGRRTLLRQSEAVFREGAYFIETSTVLERDFVDTELKIAIGAGTFVEAGATIKNHTVVERDCEIRQGAYIRGHVYVGAHSVVGHATEMKNSVFVHHVEAGHFAYIGDSLIGSFVNLGAGTKISNLEFRSLEAKKKNLFPEIGFTIDRTRIKTGISKFGTIIGDGGETGCNSVLCPFVFLGPKCWIMPNVCVFKGVYPKGTILRAAT